MTVFELANSAASMKNWPVAREPNGDMKLEVATQNGRTQVVNIRMGKDSDGDISAFIWSKAADLSSTTLDPWHLLRLNLQLTYGRVAVRDNEVLVVHVMYEADAQLAEVGKTLYWLARAADDIEQGTYGAYHDIF